MACSDAHEQMALLLEEARNIEPTATASSVRIVMGFDS
jgi:hypothetical protein